MSQDCEEKIIVWVCALVQNQIKQNMDWHDLSEHSRLFTVILLKNSSKKC